mgnify:CR=1 FL=1
MGNEVCRHSIDDTDDPEVASCNLCGKTVEEINEERTEMVCAICRRLMRGRGSENRSICDSCQYDANYRHRHWQR